MRGSIETTASDLREAIAAFLIPFQTTRVVKRDAFERMHRHAQELMRQMKGTEMVSKFLLNDLFTVPLVIRAEAPYFKEEQHELEQMASRIELCFSLILRGESPEDRVPGVPKII